MARTYPPRSYSPTAAPRAKAAPSASASTAATGKRKRGAQAASGSASKASAAGNGSDDDLYCPSDDDMPEYDSDDDAQGTSDGSSDEEEDGGGGGAGSSGSSKGKGKAKAKKKTKAQKDAEKDDLWTDLAEGEALPSSLKKQPCTGPEKGGPSSKCTRKAGDHPIMYFSDLGYDDEMFQTFANNSNLYAAGLGAGTEKLYADFLPFSADDMKKGVSILIEEVQIGKKVFDQRQEAIADVLTQKFNIVHEYNEYMNGVDAADQLRLQYYPAPKWFRNRKWWWSIFLWNVGVCCTNAYILHCKVEEAAAEEPLTHLKFLELLCDKLAHAPGEAGESDTKVLTREPKLTAGRMDARPWEACTIGDIRMPRSADARCVWCKFKARIHKDAKVSSMKKAVDEKWAKYCSHCEASEKNKTVATVLCNGCHHHFCGGACFQEFHNPQSDD